MNAAALVPIVGTAVAGVIVAAVTWLLNRGKAGADTAKAITEAGMLVLEQVQEERDHAVTRQRELEKELKTKTSEYSVLWRDFRTIRNLLLGALDRLTFHGEDTTTGRAVLKGVDQRHRN